MLFRGRLALLTTLFTTLLSGFAGGESTRFARKSTIFNERSGDKGTVTIPVLVLLAVLWAVVLVPPLLRAKAEQRIGLPDFTARLSVLAHRMGHRDAARPAMRPNSLPVYANPTRKRRRDVLIILGTAVVLTFLAASMSQIALIWLVQLFVDALTGGYVYLLLRMKRSAVERRAKVHYLPRRSSPTHLPARRTASF